MRHMTADRIAGEGEREARRRLLVWFASETFDDIAVDYPLLLK
jgi:hypothetical protein